MATDSSETYSPFAIRERRLDLRSKNTTENEKAT
jgi:hypothetical protein